jgi:hypothetical protein
MQQPNLQRFWVGKYSSHNRLDIFEAGSFTKRNQDFVTF